MSALFAPKATPTARAVLAAALVVGVSTPIVAMYWVRTGAARGQRLRVVQPVPFDHGIHVTGLRIDCRFCHAGVERTPFAGLPSTTQCIVCHNQTWMASTAFSAVRRSVATGRPIPWRRVSELPGFVYFDHSMHVTHGVGCEVCHGRVDLMPVVRQTAPLTMQWCVDCHRDPAPYLRPRDAVTVMGWRAPGSPDSLGRALAVEYRVHRETNCSTCHR
jgi:hypothetical protein